ADMFLKPPIRHVAAIARQGFRLWQIDRRSVLVGIAENEFARLERAARSGRGVFSRSFDDRLGKPVAITEMIMGMVERRHGLEVQGRENLHTVARRYQLLMFRHAAVMFGIVPR